MKTDRTGMRYEELLEIQAAHLELWRRKIVMPVFIPVREYVLSTNREAQSEAEKHHVLRGQDIIELFRTYPEINSAVYPPVVSSSPEDGI